MKILLLGESSFVHSTLRKGFSELGHDVVFMSYGTKFKLCPQDIDLRRNMKWGKLSGILLILKLLINCRKLFGNDIVQIHNFQFVPLKVWLNNVLLFLLKIGNKRVVKGCYNDDIIVFRGQARGMLKYSDTHIGTKAINESENKARLAEHMRSDYIHCCEYSNKKADALLPCLYEYYVYYNIPEYKDKLYYMPLPMEIPNDILSQKYNKVKFPIKVLVGIQEKRDYLKGAGVIAEYVERLSQENPGKIEIKKVYDVPYDDYCKMLDEADVLVDQLYSYTPSMNSLAAMAHGAVVIGGGEEEYYDFIGEEKLRPIINVRPMDDDYNMNMLRNTLLYTEKIEQMKYEGIDFIRKHHDYLLIAKKHIDLYNQLCY